jgi:hypothetical protein
MQISSIDMIDLLQLTMNIQQKRVHTASYNIAMSNQPNQATVKLKYGDFLQKIQQDLNHSENIRDVVELYSQQLPEIESYNQKTKETSLDSLVLENLQASGRYQQITDGLSRQLGLMHLSIRGSRS